MFRQCRRVSSQFRSLSTLSPSLYADTTNSHPFPNCSPFRLGADSISQLCQKLGPPPFGFNGLGEFVYQRTYARLKPDQTSENWRETVTRVVEGTFTLQKRYLLSQQLPFDANKANQQALEMWKRMYLMQFLPPGRGLWAMGSALTEERGLYASLNNCAFVSTCDMWEPSKGRPSRPFSFLMDASLLGVGVGFDTKGAQVDASIRLIPGVKKEAAVTFSIPDTREGWVESVEKLLDSYFLGTEVVTFDYSKIRPAGAPIRGFGGTSAGAGVLKQLHLEICKLLDAVTGHPLSITTIVDIMNLIGKCIVSGNVRQTAEIAFGPADSVEYLDLKNYEKNPHRAAFGWTSNNSLLVPLGHDYTAACDRVKLNGEPGFFWLENAQRYSRMNGVADDRDVKASGGNPCLEQTLESYELCCLVETFPAKHATLDDYLKTLESAYLYAKTVTLAPTHWTMTNQVMQRNRRIGTSMSGIAQFLSQNSLHALRDWCEKGYEKIQSLDKEISEFFKVPLSIKTTTIKPSGTVSLLAGATPGMHFPESRFCLRRVRLSKQSPLVAQLAERGHVIEPCIGREDSTVIVSFPIDHGQVRTLPQVSLWEQLALAAFLQRHWSDNQVSCTVTFDPIREANQLSSALDYYQYQLKGVSFLPRLELGAYPQMPIEAMTEEAYRAMIEKLSRHQATPMNHGKDVVAEKYCTSDTCLYSAEQDSELKQKAMHVA